MGSEGMKRVWVIPTAPGADVIDIEAFCVAMIRLLIQWYDRPVSMCEVMTAMTAVEWQNVIETGYTLTGSEWEMGPDCSRGCTPDCEPGKMWFRGIGKAPAGLLVAQEAVTRLWPSIKAPTSMPNTPPPPNARDVFTAVVNATPGGDRLWELAQAVERAGVSEAVLASLGSQ